MVYRPNRSSRSVGSPRRRMQGSSSGRRVAPASSLSSRFQQAHAMRREGGVSLPRGGNVGGRGRRSRARRALHVARMDIDQGNRGMRRQPSSSQTTQSRRGRGSRRGRNAVRGRGNRGGRGGRFGRMPLDKDKLDMDLENYMMGDNKTGRSVLDNDLESYMHNAA